MSIEEDISHNEEICNSLEPEPRYNPKPKIKQTPWQDLDNGGRIRWVLWVIVRIILLPGCLYLFICSLDLLSSAIRLLAGRYTGAVILGNHKLYTSPVCGVMIGMISTIFLQSSATSIAIIISMVGSGYLTVKDAIPVVMGTNIGATVTNTLVSLFLITCTNRYDFRRAFEGATVHDLFNWLTVIVLLPTEAATGYLFYISKVVVENIDVGMKGDTVDLLTAITRPFTSRVIQIDTRGISKLALGGRVDQVNTLQRLCCRTGFRITSTNTTEPYCDKECSYLFHNTGMNDYALGVVLLISSLLILCACAIAIVKILHSLLQGRIRRCSYSLLYGKFSKKAKFLALIFGMGLTMLFESSVIFTSCLTLIAGVGMEMNRIYPLTLGSNIGTTITVIITTLKMYGDVENLRRALQIAFCHFFFNISGFLIFYPIPCMRWPLGLANFLGKRAAKYRWYAVIYLIVVFFLIPFSVFYLSATAWYALLAVYTPLLLYAFIVIIIKILQNKKPKFLPRKLQNWKFLPEPCRSLDPYDRAIFRPINVTCEKHCTRCKKNEEEIGDENTVNSPLRSINLFVLRPFSVCFEKHCKCCMRDENEITDKNAVQKTNEHNVIEDTAL